MCLEYKESKMKNPLHYQMTEYDCGPTSMLNAISYLFHREEIPPEIVRNIMLYCLDCFGPDGASGKCGTSCMAMMFLSNWLSGFGQAGHLPVSSQYLSGREVNFSQNGGLSDALRRKGATVVRVDLEGWHYVLLTGIQKDMVYFFDPYYRTEPFDDLDLRVETACPDAYNRIAPIHCFEGNSVYALPPPEKREAVLLFNENTKLTAETTVEYII